MIVRQLFDSETSTYTYLLGDPDTGEAVLIDPVIDHIERDLQLLNELEMTLVYCLDTHVHADHVTAAGTLRSRTSCKTGVAATAGVACADTPLRNGDRVTFGGYTIEARETPGHTSGCLTYVVDNGNRVMAFTGDAIFVRGCGRTDFQEGDPQTLYRSVHQQIYSLGDDAILYPGHDYKGHSHTTVLEEKQHNPRLNASVTEEVFVDIMNNLNLGMPKKIDVAVPANLGCGIPAAPENESESQVPEVSPTTVVNRSVWMIVDVREPHEWEGELGFIAEAERIPQAQLMDQANEWDRNTKLLMVCRSGRRSRNAAAELIENGFTDVSNLTGGMIAWNEAHPVADPES